MSYSLHTALQTVYFQKIFVTLKNILKFPTSPTIMVCMRTREKRQDHITNQAFSQYGIFLEVEREVNN